MNTSNPASMNQCTLTFLKNSWVWLIAFILLCISMFTCVDPFPYDAEVAPPLVIVNGSITTGPGPHEIRLEWSTLYGNNYQGVIQPLANARLLIRDNTGQLEELQHGNEIGIYVTSRDFSAQVGKSYILEIILQDGRVIQSFPEPALAVPPLDSITMRTHQVPSLNPLLDDVGAQIIAHFKDPADEKNFYQWTHGESTYILVANPEEHRFKADNFNCPYCPDPKPCCDRCYRTEFLIRRPMVLADDVAFNGNALQLPVLFIEDEGLRFRDTYRIDIHQRSLSERAFRYMHLTKQQLETEGNVFDPPPANIRSNLIHLSDPDLPVLGYFMVSDVSTKRIYIRRWHLEKRAAELLIPDDCREVVNAVVEPPSDWNP